jgi:hypothetical protein
MFSDAHDRIWQALPEAAVLPLGATISILESAVPFEVRLERAAVAALE